MSSTMQTYVVGGTVRDLIMSIPSKDLDYCVECTLPELEVHVRDVLDQEILFVKEKTLTIRARKNQVIRDFTCCRIEVGDHDGRCPEYCVPADLMTDLARRDFTVNSMAIPVNEHLQLLMWDGEQGNEFIKQFEARYGFVPKHRDETDFIIVDPHRGYEGIKSNVLEFVGDPRTRLQEDGLRWLRAIRFHLVKGFEFSVVPRYEDEHFKSSTYDMVMRPPADVLRAISANRIYEELRQCFAHDTYATLQFLAELPSYWLKDGLWLTPTLEGK